MSQQWQRAIGWILCCFGFLVTLIGVWAVGGYIWGVISVLDEPDRSWMFWGLAILFIGLAGLGLGVGLIMAGRSLIKRSKA